MNKIYSSSFLTALLVLTIFFSVSANAFGELETNHYQKVEYDWFKGLFGNIFSLTPTGCTEKYETSVATAQMTQSQFPITIRCPSGYNIGSPAGSYYCQVLVIAVRNDGYSYAPIESSYIDIPVGGNKVIYWWNYNGLTYGTGVDGPYNIVGTRTITNYESWSCPTTPSCTPFSYTDVKCVSDSQATFTQCRSYGDYTIPGTLSCPSGYKCSLTSTTTAPSCIINSPSCTPNWQWGVWDVCNSNSQQTRTGADGCGNAQTQTQACTYTPPQPSCTPVWNPGSWGNCINGQQTRTVTTDTCGKTTTETQGCSMPATCAEGAKQLNNCPDGTTYDYKICRNNNWEVIPYVSSPCQTKTNCPVYESPKSCGNNEKLVTLKAGYVDSNGCNIAPETKCEPITPALDNNTKAILAIGGLSALLVGLVWFIRKRK